MKGNIMIRMISIMIIVPILLAHFTGQVDLLKPNWLWLTLLVGINGLQATFTGWCPMSGFLPKDSKTGACCISDTTGTCCAPEEPKANSNACCGDNVSRETSKTDCCSDDKNEPCCSGSGTDENKATATACCGGEGLEIKVLGTGCKTCTNAVKLIETTATEMGVTVLVIKVEDISEIASYGVMSTPGVVIDNKVVHSGGMPTKQNVKDWLSAK